MAHETLKRVVLYRDPENHTDHINDAAPTAVEFVADARQDDHYLVLNIGGVEISILFPTRGDVFFNEWNFDRFEIEETVS